MIYLACPATELCLAVPGGPCSITVALGRQGSLSLFKHIHPGYLDLSGSGHKALSFFKNTTRFACLSYAYIINDCYRMH